MVGNKKPAPQVDSPYLTITEAAAYLRFKSSAAFRMAVLREGIPHVRIGRKGRLFLKEQLDAFLKLADGTVPAAKPSKRRRVA
jgi:excisionase family DNA binding protein